MRNLSLLIKPASSNCNMRCQYCFYADIVGMRTVKNHGVMSLDTLEIIVRKALSVDTKYCLFGFQGGEPALAGLDFYKKLIELVKKYNHNKVQVKYTLQTNGLLIDSEWSKFFQENKFLVGLSIDAEKQFHDGLRSDSTGKGTHNRGMNAARLLVKHQVDFNILSVVTRQLASHPDKAYRFYKQNGFRYIQFIPCLNGLQDKPGENIYSLDAKIYGAFLCRIFDLWYADFIKGEYISIRSFDNYIRMLKGQAPENCAMNGFCTAYALIEADGGVYPCDFYAIDEYFLGNIKTHGFDEMLGGERAKIFISPSLYQDPVCGECAYYPICRGGCRREREPAVNGRLLLNCYCEAYKQFFKHALFRMKVIAQTI